MSKRTATNIIVRKYLAVCFMAEIVSNQLIAQRNRISMKINGKEVKREFMQSCSSTKGTLLNDIRLGIDFLPMCLHGE